ncbi:MAG: hypothetical protein QM640_17580 [Niabella sp.]
MSVIGYFLLFIFVWFFYNVFVKVVLPVYKTTVHLKKQFKNMARESHSQNESAAAPTAAPKEKLGEYIDFEEIK